MAFTTAAGSLTDLQKVGAGELYTTSPYSVEGASTFEDQLKIGRFAKMASGSLDNMDGSASPVIAGVVLRPVSNTYEDSAVVDTDIHNLAEFCRKGTVLVAAKAGESPTWGDPVFASNAGDANDGLATVTNTDVATGARYLETVDTNLWRVELDALADITNIAADIATIEAAITDPGDAGAIPVTKSGTCAITTAGAETRTIAAASVAGINLGLSLDVDGGDCVVTVATAVNVTGNNTLTLDNAGEYITLKSMQVGGSIVWRVIANDGVGLTTV